VVDESRPVEISSMKRVLAGPTINCTTKQHSMHKKKGFNDTAPWLQGLE
jgi:hypothetical protein